MSSLWSSQTGAGSRYGWRGGVGVVRGGGGTIGPVFVPQSTRIAWQLAARQVTSSRQIDECCKKRRRRRRMVESWKISECCPVTCTRDCVCVWVVCVCVSIGHSPFAANRFQYSATRFAFCNGIPIGLRSPIGQLNALYLDAPNRLHLNSIRALAW